MQHVCEGFSEEIRAALDDSMLRVVYDDDSNRYVVQRFRDNNFGGFYAHQRDYARRPFWIYAAIHDFRVGRFRSFTMSRKDFEREILLEHETVDTAAKATAQEASRELAKDIHHHIIAPRITSIPGIRNTRLKG